MALIDSQILVKYLHETAEKAREKVRYHANNNSNREHYDAIQGSLMGIITAIELTTKEMEQISQPEPIKNPDPTDWSNAPEWANYKATDSDGKVHWYQYKPFADDNSEEWLINGGKFTLASPINYDWNNSLEHRPT